MAQTSGSAVSSDGATLYLDGEVCDSASTDTVPDVFAAGGAGRDPEIIPPAGLPHHVPDNDLRYRIATDAAQTDEHDPPDLMVGFIVLFQMIF